MFSESRTLVEDGQRSGRKSATRAGDNTAWVRERVRSYRRLPVKMIADETNTNRETVRLILNEESGMRKICAKRGPRNLTQQQRNARLSVVFDIQIHYGDAAASLLILSSSLRLLISNSKNGSERTPFSVNIRHLEVCNSGLWHPTKCVPEILQTMAAPQEKMCAGTRDVLWRWPHWSWWINKIKLVFGNQSHYFNVRLRTPTPNRSTHYDLNQNFNTVLISFK